MSEQENHDLMEEILSKKVWAVIGANNNSSKYGNMIYNKLKNKGYTVYPVNPVYEEVEGQKCYSNIESIPDKVEVLEMVVSPKRGKVFIEEASKLGIKYVWLQPGTFDDELIELGKEKNIKMLQACVLVALS